MVNSKTAGDSSKEAANEKGSSSAPSISLPKGGGAIRGIGEKFAANPITGTGSMTVPIYTSPGRSGFDPQLAVSYDSGAGNGPFGFGWQLSLPSITRKTDRGLPKYDDGAESDVFVLSGAEDLVPVLEETPTGWKRPDPLRRMMNGVEYTVRRYRPRIEGLFARIERWTEHTNAAHTFWRSISKDNITTWYGKTEESRVADPHDAARIFQWLICETHDDKGNVIAYGYKKENSDSVDVTRAHERNRNDKTRSANRYLKRVRYGNRTPFFQNHEPDLPASRAPRGLRLDVRSGLGLRRAQQRRADAGRSRQVEVPPRSVFHLPRWFRDPHVSPMSAVLDVPPLQGRDRRRR